MKKLIITAVLILAAAITLSGCGRLRQNVQTADETPLAAAETQETIAEDTQAQENGEMAEYYEVSSLDGLTDMGDIEELHDLLEIEISDTDIDTDIDELMEIDTLTDETKNIKDH